MVSHGLRYDTDMEPTTQYKHLERDPKSSYRQLSIKGRRIRARTLYGLYMSAEEPMTPAEIAEGYQLPLEAVMEAIAYCQSDPVEIRQDFAFEEAIMEARGMNDPNYKYEMKAKPLSAQEYAEIHRRIYGS